MHTPRAPGKLPNICAGTLLLHVDALAVNMATMGMPELMENMILTVMPPTMRELQPKGMLLTVLCTCRGGGERRGNIARVTRPDAHVRTFSQRKNSSKQQAPLCLYEKAGHSQWVRPHSRVG